MKSLILAAFAILALAACSSSPKPVADRVKETEKAMAKTDKILTETREELGSFAKKLTELKKDAADDIPMARKSRYEASLDRLQLSVQQSQLDLTELQASNLEKKKVFESRVNQALDPNAVPAEVYEAD